MKEEEEEERQTLRQESAQRKQVVGHAMKKCASWLLGSEGFHQSGCEAPERAAVPFPHRKHVRHWPKEQAQVVDQHPYP